MAARRVLVALAVLGGGAALVVGFLGSFLVAVALGVLVAVVCLVLLVERTRPEPDASRRRFLRWSIGGVAFALVGGGAVLGAVLKRLVRSDPRPMLEAAARGIGGDYLELVTRAYHAGRSGDLQLLVTPYSTSNYPQESRALLPNDPRSSHAVVWMYGQRVPIVVWSPGLVPPSDSTERVTLADIAPTMARLAGFSDFRAADGVPLPATPTPSTPPKVIVTLVIDGGGWNVLTKWPDAWPNLERLMREGATYRNAITGSFPAVTAAAHATIGTGAFPRTHGITGHNVRMGDGPVKAWGTPGRANPNFLLTPTLADRWTAATDDRAWVGEIGYQVWHLGMLGHGGRPDGELPVGVFWDEAHGGGWKPHNPELYRLPKRVPDPSQLEELTARYDFPPPSPYDTFIDTRNKDMCCWPPIVRYQGLLIESTLDSEPIGRDDVTDMLFVNFKMPDYAGHTWNMDDVRVSNVLAAVDEEIGSLAEQLRGRYGDGNFVFIVTADHGQCPEIDANGGVRIDPIQLEADVERALGSSTFSLVQSVAPSEIYLDHRALPDSGVSAEDVAAWLEDYRYGENIGPYIEPDAIRGDRLGERTFAAVLPTSFIADLATRDLSRYGETAYPGADPYGIPEVTW